MFNLNGSGNIIKDKKTQEVNDGKKEKSISDRLNKFKNAGLMSDWNVMGSDEGNSDASDEVIDDVMPETFKEPNTPQTTITTNNTLNNTPDEDENITVEKRLNQFKNAGLVSDDWNPIASDEDDSNVFYENENNGISENYKEPAASEIIETTDNSLNIKHDENECTIVDVEDEREEVDKTEIEANEKVVHTENISVDNLTEDLEKSDNTHKNDVIDEYNDNIIDDDDIVEIDDDSLSELILPKGSDIKIEELKFKHDSSHLDIINKTQIPVEIESLWEKTIKNIVDTEELEEIEEIKPEKSLYDKIINKFTRRDYEIKEYSFVEHGPIVDFDMPSGSNYKEVDLYEVNPPYAYVRIIHDPDLHESKYQVIEPTLSDNENKLFKTIKTRLVETLDVNLKNINSDNAKEYLKTRVHSLLKDYRINLSPQNREKILYYIIRDFVGYGEIDVMMRDTLLEDISCDGPKTPIYVYHKKYESIPATVQFHSDEDLDSFVIRTAQVCGRHISISNPLLDATMTDGSRIQLTLGREVTTRGSTFTIRRFNEKPMTPVDLINVHTFSTAMVAYMWLAVESSKSIVFAGGTASGKTTAMNAISLFIQPEMKIVSIEDTRELNLPHPNWIPGVTRESFAGESKGSIEMYELLRASLRQRPEYILVGEVRGAEAYVLFQAMSTGHTTFSTMHADSVQSVVHRLENPPINVPRIMMQALDVVAIQAQVKIGDERVRRCKSLTEIVGVDPRTGELLTNEVFIWNAAKDVFQYSGRSYVVESVMENRGWDEIKVKDELKRRQEVLEWVRIKEIGNYEDISKIIVAYNREPEMLMKIVRQDLYG